MKTSAFFSIQIGKNIIVHFLLLRWVMHLLHFKFGPCYLINETTADQRVTSLPVFFCRICVITLAETHPILQNGRTIKSYQLSNKRWLQSPAEQSVWEVEEIMCYYIFKIIVCNLVYYLPYIKIYIIIIWYVILLLYSMVLSSSEFDFSQGGQLVQVGRSTPLTGDYNIFSRIEMHVGR